MDARSTAPPVVAVVVTCDAGRWLDDCVRALRVQDYPNLAVLVVDAASTVDPTSRVAQIDPCAFTRRLPVRGGFAAAANEVLRGVSGASHYLFCHDDVVPAPDAVRVMVEEALRSNAGVVAPKLVERETPDRLLAVGAGADKGGTLVDLVERGDLDQEQHDAVRDVFVAPAGCMLVRADLFATLGGFDVAMSLAGEDLDFCWRAQVAGARVVVAPGARVQHGEVTRRGVRSADGGTVIGGVGGRKADVQRAISTAREDARVRAVIKNYGLWQLLRVLPQLLLIAVVEVTAALAMGRVGRARSTLHPWWRAASTPRDLWRERRRLHRVRSVPDGEMRARQVGGHALLRALVRRLREGPRPGGHATKQVNPLRHSLPVFAGVLGSLTLIVLFGSRHLLGRQPPLIGEFSPFASPSALWAAFTTGHSTSGPGTLAPAPVFAILSAAGALVWGHMALLQRLFVFATIPLGGAGAWFLARSFGLGRARLVTVVLYVASPLPYNALASGHWGGLIAYGVIPWILTLMVRPAGLACFGAPRVPGSRTTAGTLAGATVDGTDHQPCSLRLQALRLGVVLGLAGAFAPVLLPVTVGMAVALVVGSLLTGGVRPLVRSLVVAVAGAVVACGLLFPWSWTLLMPVRGAWLSLTGPPMTGAHALALARLLRFQTGANGAGPLGWGVLIAAALPLVVGGRWRWMWAARLWVLATAGWATAWAANRGWLALPAADLEIILVPALAGLALCSGLGAAVFETELRGYHFGWRQVVAALAAASAVVAMLPVLGSAIYGRWHLPATGFDTVLSWMPEKKVDGHFRVLWLGDPDVLPVHGWQLDSGLGLALSEDGGPDVLAAWPQSQGPPRQMATTVALAGEHRTADLGRLLAPMGVRYVVVVSRSAPSAEPGTGRPAPPSLLEGLAAQVDLTRLPTDPALVLYENDAWVRPGPTLSPPAVDTSVLVGAPVTRRASLAIEGSAWLIALAYLLIRRRVGRRGLPGPPPGGGAGWRGRSHEGGEPKPALVLLDRAGTGPRTKVRT